MMPIGNVSQAPGFWHNGIQQEGVLCGAMRDKRKGIGGNAQLDAIGLVTGAGGVIGNYLSNTAWQFADVAGRWGVEAVTLSGRSCKCITAAAVTANVISLNPADIGQTPAQAAYGTYEFSFSGAASGGSGYGWVMGSVRGTYNSAGQNGYICFVGPSFPAYFAVYPITNGVLGTLSFLSTNILAANTLYTIRGVRTAANVWTWYVLGGAYGSWTKLPVFNGANPYTNATWTSFAWLNWLHQTTNGGVTLIQTDPRNDFAFKKLLTFDHPI
jgi:hypothetical protein